jgi:hypothetical protein
MQLTFNYANMNKFNSKLIYSRSRESIYPYLELKASFVCIVIKLQAQVLYAQFRNHKRTAYYDYFYTQGDPRNFHLLIRCKILMQLAHFEFLFEAEKPHLGSHLVKLRLFHI